MLQIDLLPLTQEKGKRNAKAVGKQERWRLYRTEL